MERRVPPGGDNRSGLSARIPLAVVVGRPAIDLLPVSGALGGEAVGAAGRAAGGAAYDPEDDLGPDLDASLNGETFFPTAGRARFADTSTDAGDADAERVDVLRWAYPLVGPGPERLLVLAADAGLLHTPPEETESQDEFERIAPGFALHTEFPGADDLARRLPEILPSMSVAESRRIVSQILELGYPVLEISSTTGCR